MRNFGLPLYIAACLVVTSSGAVQGQDTTAGATSKEGLAKLYRRSFESRNVQKLQLLVYWPGVAQRDRDAFMRSVQQDLKFKLKNVEFASVGDTTVLEYTLDGTVYRPTLTPVARLVARYEDTSETKNVSTSYLVGVKDQRYYITLASRVSTAMRQR